MTSRFPGLPGDFEPGEDADAPPLAAQAAPAPLTDALEQMRVRKDAAYEERNKVVAALARLFPSGVAKTAIEGWSEDWHGCVYIDLPTGQVSWHFHDSQAHLFAGLPPYAKSWDGHDTPEKYRRLAALAAPGVPPRPEQRPGLAERIAAAESELARMAPEDRATLRMQGQPISAVDGVLASSEPHPFTFHWLVELRPAFDGHPTFPATYYAGWIDGIDAAKTTNPLEAVRFTSKDHAERMARRLGFTLSCVWQAVEHGFATAGVDLPDGGQRDA